MGMVEWYEYVAVLFLGSLAGFINTLAGSGSMITLSLLMFMGLPAHIANGTNRLGIVFQSVTGAYQFHKAGKLDFAKTTWFSLPALVGSLVGAWIATALDARQMEQAIGVVMIFMLAILLLKPEKWLRENSEIIERRTIWNMIFAFLIGIYGGFIMIGVGILILAVLVLKARMNLAESNAIKILTVFLFSLPVLAIYAYKGQVDWLLASVLALGQATGAWFASKFALNNPHANRWTHRLLIIDAVVSIIKFFRLYEVL